MGLRITANVQVQGAKVNVSGLGSIGAEADANRLSGSMTIQTLGVNGRSISASLPIQSELNRTTVTSAIVAVGSIKALLFEDETQIAPRVVGLYLPLSGDQELVNAIISAIASDAVTWDPKSNVELNKPKGG